MLEEEIILSITNLLECSESRQRGSKNNFFEHFKIFQFPLHASRAWTAESTAEFRKKSIDVTPYEGLSV